MLVLYLRVGQPDEWRYRLPAGVTTIGRDDANGVQVLDKSLSRVHARIEVTRDEAYVVDLQSKNGTMLNGARVTRAPIAPGDTITCGDVVFTVGPWRRDAAVDEPISVRAVQPRFAREHMRQLLRDDAERSRSLRLEAAPEADTRADKLQILLRLGHLLSGAPSIEALLETIVDMVFEVFDVDCVALLMVAPGGDRLERRVVRKSPTAGDGDHSERITEYVRARGVAALFADARDDNRVGEAVSVVLRSICSVMCAPLKPADAVLGVLYLDNRSRPDRFHADDLEFLTAFANQVGVALENALLHEKILRDAVLHNNLLRFFPPSITQRIVALDQGWPEPVETEVTALFCDISDFTVLSRSLAPRALIDLLNEFFAAMAEVVFRHEGTLEKYIGDAILAVWGAPFAAADDADRAVRAAVEMQRAMGALNARLSARGQRPLAIHVGLNSGPVAAGNVGTERYLQYATIGETTNVAARICGVAGPGEVLLSESTRARLRSHVDLEAMRPSRVKGVEVALNLHRVRWEAPR